MADEAAKIDDGTPFTSFGDMFRIYPNRNPELRALCKLLYEFGMNIAQEPSAARSAGIDMAAIKRNETYCAHAKKRLDQMKASPRPDNGATHPAAKPINMSVPYVQFVEDKRGDQVPLNEDTQLLAEMYLGTAVELARSATASDAGSVYGPDHKRAIANVGAIEKYVAECKERYESEELDLIETQNPGAILADAG